MILGLELKQSKERAKMRSKDKSKNSYRKVIWRLDFDPFYYIDKVNFWDLFVEATRIRSFLWKIIILPIYKAPIHVSSAKTKYS